MEVVMCRLKDVTMDAAVPVDTRSLLLSLVELRASNWGRNVDPAQESPSSAPKEPDVPHVSEKE